MHIQILQAHTFIQPGAAQGPKAVMGPGTGLGQANLYWSQNLDGYRVWPSEGSHASFAPRGWKQRALQTFVERQLGYCEVEHVSLQCSGCSAISWALQASRVTTGGISFTSHLTCGP